VGTLTDANTLTTGFLPANHRRSVIEGHPVLPPGRMPALRHEDSSTGSTASGSSIVSSMGSSRSSFGRSPGESSLPIHALLSNRRTDVPIGSSYEQNSSPVLPGVAGLPDQGRQSFIHPNGLQGYGFQSGESALQHLQMEQSASGDVEMTSPSMKSAPRVPPSPRGSGKDVLDGMNALLRAGEIVNRRNGDGMT